MENGASDSIYFAQAGIPCYGYSAIALERDDDRAHGQDERLPVDSYWKSLDFFYAFPKSCRRRVTHRDPSAAQPSGHASNYDGKPETFTYAAESS